jgi:hypothetical protein
LDDIEDRLGIRGLDVYQADRRFTGKLEKEKNMLTKFKKIRRQSVKNEALTPAPVRCKRRLWN